ncbi:glycosyltransferase [Paraglaciecola sp. L3A3]|uniref:glycosyltransferase n=1 Tax=Paraglaciecola sp. L3A3 TaxID=2686358 RepID=UPI00131BD7D1|nr:glycosyltransferase [Paraglaciecola sp. L3A3]
MEKIFFAHSVNVIGGAERVTLAIISGIKPNCQTVMLAPKGNELGNAAELAGASFVAIDANQPDKSKPFSYIKQFWQYYCIFKKHKPKLVHTGDLLALRSLQPICKFLNIPMICHVHFPYEESFMNWTLKNRYAPRTFIFCSNELKLHLLDTLTVLCPNSAMEVIHNGVDTTVFKPLDTHRSLIPRIGIIANLQYRKGHDDFLNMAKILIEQGIDAQFDIIGGDILQEPREPYLKQKAKELGISGKVIFHGQLPDVKAELQKLDIVVCASHEEAFPISILEAMACGKAIVSTNVNGIPEALTHDETALLVNPHDPQSLAMCVNQLLVSPEKVTMLSNNAREKVLQNFSSEVFIKKIKQLYGES